MHGLKHCPSTIPRHFAAFSRDIVTFHPAYGNESKRFYIDLIQKSAVLINYFAEHLLVVAHCVHLIDDYRYLFYPEHGCQEPVTF